MKWIGAIQEFHVDGDTISWKHSKRKPSIDILFHVTKRTYTVADKIHGKYISSEGDTDTYEYTPGEIDKDTAIKYARKNIKDGIYFCAAATHPSFPTLDIFRDILHGIHTKRPVIIYPSITKTLFLLTHKNWTYTESVYTSPSHAVDETQIVNFIAPLINEWYFTWLKSKAVNRLRFRLLQGDVSHYKRQTQNYIKALLKKKKQPLKLTPIGKSIIIKSGRRQKK